METMTTMEIKTREDIVNYVYGLVSRSIFIGFEGLTKSQLEDHVFDVVFEGLDSIGLFNRFHDTDGSKLVSGGGARKRNLVYEAADKLVKCGSDPQDGNSSWHQTMENLYRQLVAACGMGE